MVNEAFDMHGQCNVKHSLCRDSAARQAKKTLIRSLGTDKETLGVATRWAAGQIAVHVRSATHSHILIRTRKVHPQIRIGLCQPIGNRTAIRFTSTG